MKLSQTAMADAYGIHPRTLRDWIERAAATGEDVQGRTSFFGPSGVCVSVIYETDTFCPWITRTLGIDAPRLKDCLEAATPDLDPPQPRPTPTTQCSIETESDAQTITTKSTLIRTVADALQYAEVDEKQWCVDRHTINSWEVVSKDADGQPQVTPLWQVKVWLKRKALAHDAILDDLIRRLPAKPESARYYEAPSDPHLLEVSLFDQHFGKLSWHHETGEDYDLEIAERVYAEAVEDLLHKASPFPIERIVFPIGNDFLHIDNLANTTTHGTIQDVDGRLQKIIVTGQMSLIHAIDRMLTVAPVDVLLVPGNHDELSIWHTARFLWAYYRNTEAVNVDVEPRARKYYRYGNSLIGFTHGQDERHASLPAIMATEVPQLWAETQCREWHLGHLHKKRETQFTPVDRYDGVVVRVLPSLTGTDKWHYSKGYIGSQTAEAYLWSKERGHTGYLVTRRRP